MLMKLTPGGRGVVPKGNVKLGTWASACAKSFGCCSSLVSKKMLFLSMFSCAVKNAKGC